MGGRPSELGTGRQRENPSPFSEFANLTIGLKHTRNISGDSVSPWKTLFPTGKGDVDQDFVDTKAERLEYRL